MQLSGPDPAPDDEGRAFSLPPLPDDRLWRHPSELDHGPPRHPFDGDPKPRRRRGPWAIPLVAGLTGALLTLGGLQVSGALDREEPRPGVTREISVPVSAPSRPTGVVGIAEEVRPAIARIDVEGDGDSSGSGVLFRDDGHLLTNAHVVDGADRVTVVLADGEQLDADVVGSDPVTDIAVLSVERDADDPFPTAILGSAAELEVGQPAIAIGSPLGLAGGSSVTTGVVSALGREVDGEDGSRLFDMVQTDAAISPGSSGGALLDSRGAVIGITTAIAVSEVGAEGLGFATPVDIARSVAEEIIMTGRAVHVWLGIEGTDLPSGAAEDLGLTGGALVERVLDDSPAAGAGLGRRDVILTVDGEAVSSMSALVISLRDRDPGEVVELEVVRNGIRSMVPVTLAERPRSAD